MNKKQAIKILQEQLEKTKEESLNNAGQTFLFQTASYIKDFFGKDSIELRFVSKFKFVVMTNGWDYTDEQISDMLAEKPKIFSDFLSNCIETLNNKGIYKEPKTNFLSKMSDQAVIALISFICIPVFSGGYFCGNYFAINKIDEQKIEMKRKIDSLNKLLPIPLSKSSVFETDAKNKSSINTKK